MIESQQFQIKVETALQNILKRDNDPVAILQALSAAEPEVRAEVCRQFRTNEMLRESFPAAATIFDEVVEEPDRSAYKF